MRPFLFYMLLILISSSVNAQDLKQVLTDISAKAIELNQDYFTSEQLNNKWIGYSPATESEIQALEQRLGIELLKDFKEFLLITNGFHDANGVEPSFCDYSKIDYLKNTNPELLEIWSFPSDKSFTSKFRSAIQVGGFDEEQQFFLIPPGPYNSQWEYWHFAAWSPGEAVYGSLLEYFNSVLETTNQFLKKK